MLLGSKLNQFDDNLKMRLPSLYSNGLDPTSPKSYFAQAYENRLKLLNVESYDSPRNLGKVQDLIQQ